MHSALADTENMRYATKGLGSAVQVTLSMACIVGNPRIDTNHNQSGFRLSRGKSLGVPWFGAESNPYQSIVD